MNELQTVSAAESTSLEASLANITAKGIDVVSPNEFLAKVYMTETYDIEIRIKAATAAKKDNAKEQTQVGVAVNNAPAAKPNFELM